MSMSRTLFALTLLAAPLAAQQALNEQFNYSTTTTFPPTGWSQTMIIPGSPGWEEPAIASAAINWTVLAVDAAGHDDFNSGGSHENLLHTPTLDLSSFGTPELTFDEDVEWINYMAHHPASNGNGVSTIELSTDGGTTWTVEWTEANTVNGYYPGNVVDLASYAGQPAVDMQFHYFGDWAHCWAIDNVVVDNGGNPTGPGLNISGTCPGPGSIDCTGMTPGGLVYIGYSFSGGTFTIPTGPCTGAIVPIATPTLLFAVAADAGGNISIPGVMPATACGVIQMAAFDTTTCTASNSVAL